MKFPITINGRQYYYQNKISAGEFSDSHYASFYIKGKPLKKRVVKRKYFLFGPIIQDEIIEVDNFIACFDVNIDLTVGSIINPVLLKRVEEEHNNKIQIIEPDKIVI